MTRPPRFACAHSLLGTRLRAAACSLLAALALGGCHDLGGEQQRQAEAVGTFYTIHLKSSGQGLPAPDELRQYQPLLSRALFTLLTQAEAAESRHQAIAGNQAPPLIEGDLFTSLYEGASSFTVESCESGDQRDDPRASCQVAFNYRKDGAAETWSDKILLVREDGKWRIDDIEFVGNDQSSHREYLTDTLADAIKEAG